MKLKKILSIAGITALSALTLAACSSGSSSSSSSSSSESTEKETIVMGTVGTTKSFSYQDEEGELTGFDIELARTIFEGSDQYELSIEKTDGNSQYPGLDSERFDLLGNNTSYTTERGEKYLYSYPTASTPSVLAVRNDTDIKSYEDIGGHSTQVVAGTTTAAQLEEYNEKHADNPVNINYTSENITQILTNLNDGKHDFKIFDAPTVNAIVADQKLTNVKTIELQSKEKPFIYYVFTSDNTELQKFVNKRIKELNEDGTIAELTEKFFGENYAPTADELVVPNE